MSRFSVNLGFLFTEVPFLDRFGAAREAGFDAVEFAWPQVAHDELRAAAQDARVAVVQMNMDAGDLAAGERGWASHPAAVEKWREAFEAALELAEALACPRINVLAGNAMPDTSRDELMNCLSDNLRWAVPRATASGRTLLIEVLNPTDTPDYLFTSTAAAEAFLTEFGDRWLKLQFDTYHVACGGEDPATRFGELAPFVGHIQVADFPGSHQPGTGKIDFGRFFDAVVESRYDGSVGLEYLPSGDTLGSLAWLPTADRRSS